jgi:hypothetical protein
MLNLKCNIGIRGKDSKNITFDYLNGCEIKTSCKNLTDTAVLRIPRKIQWKGLPLTNFINIDDEITIALGYAETGLETLFKGYISHIENGTPLVISAENMMRAWKKITVPAQKIAKFDVKAFLQKYAPGVKITVADGLKFGSLDIQTEMSLTGALDAIMQKYPYLTAYFMGDEFRAHLSTERWQGTLKPVVFSPDRNMISDSLKYERSEDIKTGVKAVSILRDNTQLEAFAPAAAFDSKTTEKGKTTKTIKKGWNQRQFFAPQIDNQGDLQDFAQKMAKEWNSDKMSGSFTAFGVPLVHKGELVQLKDKDRPERNDKKFVVDSVDYTFGTGGYRRNITLGVEIK